MSIAELLLRAAREFPRSGVRLILAGGESLYISYPELLEQSRRILGGLKAYNLAPGAKIALFLDHPADFLPAFWGCVLGGYVPCPVAADHILNLNELLDGPLFITTTVASQELLDVVSVDVAQLRSDVPEESHISTASTDAAVLMLASPSKAVVLTHGNLLASMAGKARAERLTSLDVTLNWMPLSHVAGLIEVHLLAMYVGVEQLNVDPAAVLADPLQLLHIIHQHRVTMTVAHNSLLAQINSAVQTAASLPVDLSCLRHFIAGGEPNVVGTGKRFLEQLAPYGLARNVLWPAFGMIETCAGCLYSREFPDGDVGQEFASVGLPVAGLDLRIVDEQGAELMDFEPGEVQIRGSVVFGGYYNNDAVTRAAFTRDGWFRTGFQGQFEDGRLSLLGEARTALLAAAA